jgi:hypothetical protein
LGGGDRRLGEETVKWVVGQGPECGEGRLGEDDSVN